MKKLLIVLVGITLFMCCNPQSRTENHQAPKEKEVEAHRVMGLTDTPSGISIIVIDNCEYIYCEISGHSASIIHKQNCKNLIHTIK